jgi:hypothetical protein
MTFDRRQFSLPLRGSGPIARLALPQPSFWSPFLRTILPEHEGQSDPLVAQMPPVTAEAPIALRMLDGNASELAIYLAERLDLETRQLPAVCKDRPLL